MAKRLFPGIASPLVLAVLLAGCTSGPSESDVRGAVEDSVDALNEQIVAMAGSLSSQVGKYELTEFELIGCEASGESYSCDVVMSMDTPLIPVTDRASSLRLRKGDKGWIVMGGLQ